MNERIEKLGEEVDLLGEFTPTKIPGRYVGYITEEKILKFAELIVRECMNICTETQEMYFQHRIAASDFNYKNIYAEGEAACDLNKYKMKKHFGVSE